MTICDYHEDPVPHQFLRGRERFELVLPAARGLRAVDEHQQVLLHRHSSVF